MPTQTPPTTGQRRLVAILAADVQGYTELIGIDELETVNRVKLGIALFRKLVNSYGGRITDEVGDGLIAIFESVLDAVQFAVEVQRDFRRGDTWIVGKKAVRFRVGVHVGEVIIAGDQAHGYHINVASRVESMASPGGICISEHVHRALPAEFQRRLHSRGPQVLKNVPDLIELFDVEIEEPGEKVVPQFRDTPTQPRSPIDDEIKVAILPLRNSGGSPAGQSFCDGVTGDIIVNLSRFREFAVIARNSSFALRNDEEDLPSIARRLDVRYIVTGNLQLSDQQMRVRVQLQNGENGRVLWSDRFTGQLQDIFDFQDEVTAQVASRLATQLRAEERRRIQDGHTPPIEAYGLIIRGHDLSMRYRKEANLHALQLFEHATNLDPHYGRCYTGISRSLNLAWRYRWNDKPEQCLEKAIELARLAINYDELDARAHAELGYAHLYRKEHSNSIGAYERALDLNANDADIIAEYGDALVYDGRPQEAIPKIERAMKLNPVYPDWYLWHLADAFNAMQQPENVVATVEKMRDISEGRRLLAANYAHLGMEKEATMHATELLRSHPTFNVSTWARRPPYKDQSALEHFMEGLRKAGLPET